MAETVVTASRFGIRALESPVPVTVVSSSSTGIASVSSLIQSGMGVFMKDYGGNSIKLPSLRGSTSEQVLVLINGMRLNNPATGLIDLGLLNDSQVDRIEIMRGGGSSLYGADAVGGVINIITRSPDDAQAVHASAAVSSSSYQNFATTYSLQFPVGPVFAYATYSKMIQPDSSYQVHDALTQKKVYRVNASSDADITSVSVALPFGPEGSNSLRIFNQFVARLIEVPGTIENNRSNLAQAVQRDRVLIVNPDLELSPKAFWKMRLQAGYTYAWIHYTNPKIILSPSSSTVTNAFSFQAINQVQLNAANTAVGGYAWTRNTGHGDEINRVADWSQSLFYEHRVAFHIGAVRLLDLLTLFPAIRADHFSQYQTAYSPKFGFNALKESETWSYSIRGSISRNFRAPTFNERYWSGDGASANPDVKPERSVSQDAGIMIVSMVGGNRFKLDGSVFDRRTRSQIVWQPGAIVAGDYSPVNLSKTRASGFELAAEHTYGDLWKCEGSYVRTKALDLSEPERVRRMQYAPLYSIRFFSEIHWGKAMISQTTRYVSQRFTSSDNRAFLKPYRVTDAQLRYTSAFRKLQWALSMGIDNVFDEAYENLSLYPGTAREITFGISLSY